MIKRYKYVGNRIATDTTSVIEVGEYVAKIGDVIPIKQEILSQIENIFVLEEQTDSDVTATKTDDVEGPVDTTPAPPNTPSTGDLAKPETTTDAKATLQGGKTGSGGGK